MSDPQCTRDVFATALEALGPLRNVREVTANIGATAPQQVVWRGLYVGTSGDVTIETEEGQTVTLKSIAAGMWHGVYFRRVFAGASAGGILVGQ